jgi:hypothetical protein
MPYETGVANPSNSPSGFEKALAAAESVKLARARFAEAEASIKAKEAELQKERASLSELRAAVGRDEKRFQEIIQSGQCVDPDCAPPHRHDPKANDGGAKHTNGASNAANGAAPKSTAAKPGLPSDWATLGKKWQLAWLLFFEPVLDFEAAGQRIYGHGGADARAKINALVTDLRRSNALEKAPGRRCYKITLTREQLIARSGSKGEVHMAP